MRSPYRDHMAAALDKRGYRHQVLDAEWIDVYGATPEQVGIAAAEDGITLYGLQPRQRSLEDTFLRADRGAAAAMNRMLKAELIKVRTTRTFFALTGAGVGISLVVVILVGLLAKSFSHDDLMQTFSGDFTPLFVLLLGAIGMAGEWRHKTITSTVLAAPQRSKLMLAKALSYAVAGVVLSFLVSIVVMAVGTLIISSRGFDTLGFSDLLDILWRNLVVAAYLGPIGVFVGALIRNPAGAIVVLLADLFVVENVLQGLVPDVWRFMPLGAGPQSVQQSDIDHLLSPGVGLLVMAGWLIVFYAAAAVTFNRRDLT